MATKVLIRSCDISTEGLLGSIILVRHVRPLSCSAPYRTLRAPDHGNSARPETNHHVIPSTVFFPEPKTFSLVPHFTGGLLCDEESLRSTLPSFDVSTLSPPLACLTLGKIRLCSFSLVQLPKLQRQLERLIKVKGRRKSTFLLFA